jgi:hypothetical protein
MKGRKESSTKVLFLRKVSILSVLKSSAESGAKKSRKSDKLRWFMNVITVA